MEAARVPRGTAYVSAQNALNFLVGLIFYMVVARILPTEDIGSIAALTFVYSTVPAIIPLALPTAAAKFVSEYLGRGESEKAGAVVSAIKKIVFSISILTLVLMAGVANWFSILLWGNGNGALIFLIISFAVFVSTIRITYLGFLQGLQWFGKFAIAAFTAFALGRVLGMILVVAGWSLIGVVIGWLIGEAVGLILTMLLFRGALPKPTQKCDLRMLFRFSLPLFVMFTIITLADWTDRMLFFGLTHELASLGIYDLAVRGAATISIIWMAFSTTVLPMLSGLYGKTGKEAVRAALKTSLRYLTYLTLPACFGLAAISRTVMALLFGRGYTAGSPLLAILAVASISISFGMIFGSTLQALGETRMFIGIGLASIVADVLVIILSVPILGVLGATLARVTLWGVYSAATFLALRTKAKIEFDGEALQKGFLASVIMAAPLLIFDMVYASRLTDTLTVICASSEILLGIAIYGISLIALRALHSQDFELLKRIVPTSLHGFLNLFRGVFTR